MKKYFAIASLIILLFILVFIYIFFTDTPGNATFDSESWKAGESLYRDIPSRGAMVNDLLHSHKLIGMSKAEIRNLLGEPSSYSEIFANGDVDYFYWLSGYGGSGCFMPDIDVNTWLRIRFTGGVVEQAKILSACDGSGLDSVKDD